MSVLLDMVEGKLSFAKNGENWGVAFESEELKTGALYPAVSPIYMNDEFKLRLPSPED